MIDIVYTISKYLILIGFALFTFVSFRAQRDIPDELKSRTFATQRYIMIAIHALCHFVICLHILSGTADLNIWYVLGFYLGQLAYLLFMTVFLPRIVHLNPGLNNVMCMFLALGFVIQTRLSFDTSFRQFLIVLAGSVIFVIFCVFCKRATFLRNLTWLYCFVGMGLLILVFALSTFTRGAKLSLDIGPFSFQPLEFVKILFVFFVASAFHRSSSFKTVVIITVFAAVHVLIQVMCNDLGSAFILFVVYILMLYVATRKFVYILAGVGGFSVAAFAAYKLFSHVQVRVSAWLDPWSDIENTGWQIAQSLFAIGTGGWFGSGLFQGSPGSIPLVSKDMVIAAISEEFGMLFSIFLILLCLCFTLMIFRVAIRIEMTFHKLLAFGLGVCYAIQVFLTIGGAFKFIPLTGVTLPFISSGGSSILSSMIILGIIQALYVISESDVAHERRMVAAGVDLSEFPGYEDFGREEYEEKVRLEREDRRRARQDAYDDDTAEDHDAYYDGTEGYEDEEAYDEEDVYEEWNASSDNRHIVQHIDPDDIDDERF